MMTKKTAKARFHNPPNTLKAKVGSGGLSNDILKKAQSLLEENNIDFEPVAHIYVEALRRGLDQAHNPPAKITPQRIMDGLVNPIMQLKANGAMFRYGLVSKISAQMVSFIESIDEVNEDSLEIIQAYHTTITAILHGRLKGDGGEKGEHLCRAITEACERYYKRYEN